MSPNWLIERLRVRVGVLSLVSTIGGSIWLFRCRRRQQKKRAPAAARRKITASPTNKPATLLVLEKNAPLLLCWGVRSEVLGGRVGVIVTVSTWPVIVCTVVTGVGTHFRVDTEDCGAGFVSNLDQKKRLFIFQINPHKNMAAPQICSEEGGGRGASYRGIRRVHRSRARNRLNDGHRTGAWASPLQQNS
jgi:hypothetical protein